VKPGEARAPEWPAAVLEVVTRLRRAGLEAFLVGGAVRDRLLDRAVRDYDLLVPAGLERAAAALPEAARVSRRHPVLLLPGAGERPRVEVDGLREGARDLEQDLRARDFTLNAIAWDPERARFVDPTGGLADLAARRLRAAQPDAALRADPLRILRGVRLAAELSLEIDAATERAMERASYRLGAAAGERLREELFRVLELADPLPALERLRRVGALASVLPELLRGVGVGQNRLHPDDVYRHSLRVCQLAPATPLLRLAALLHDVAKPETKSRADAADFRFLRHELCADTHVERVAARLRLSREEHDRLARLVRHHLIFPERLGTPSAVRRLIRRAGRDILDPLLELRRADVASRSPDGAAGPEWDAAEARVREAAEAIAARRARLAVDGRLLMAELGLPEGPELGRWLRRAERRVQEHPEENERGRLLAWLRERHRAEEEEGGG
jgi:tRNA nucleotidyltransferase/poly(A) polymerase